MQRNPELERAMDACAERLDFLNQTYPLLTTKMALEGVLRWRQRRTQQVVTEPEEMAEPEEIAQLKGIAQPGEIAQPEQQPVNDRDITALVGGLIGHYSFEEVLDLLLNDHQIELTPAQLANAVGKKQYLNMLKRDVEEMMTHAISYEQIAVLWNDLGRPTISGGEWNSRGISMLAG